MEIGREQISFDEGLLGKERYYSEKHHSCGRTRPWGMTGKRTRHAGMSRGMVMKDDLDDVSQPELGVLVWMHVEECDSEVDP
jgi:hypothetical protein